MTTAEQLVTSLEISQKLKDLGVLQGQSYFVWCKREFDLRRPDGFICDQIIPRFFIESWELFRVQFKKPEILCDAFTLSEIREANKKISETIKWVPELNINYPLTPDGQAENLIWLIENKYPNPKDLKL